MATYRDYCKGGQALNTIVMAGSHDAGVTRGAWNVKTQDLNIAQQARSGVRVFDLRIAAFTSGGTTGGVKNVEMRAYHADGLLKTKDLKTRYVTELGQNAVLQRTKLRGGDYGENLAKILGDARAFVEDPNYATEFLILKFDKCLNYPLIAQACVALLDGVLYTDGGNLNTKTLDELEGSVIVVFTEEGTTAIGNAYGPDDGILGIKNCSAPGNNYSDDYDGLQYYGKGGTNIVGPAPVWENRRKQKGLMRAGIQSDPEVMGMMYWTSTGLFGDIKKRNKDMWSRTNRAALQATWRNGLAESIADRQTKALLPDGGGNMAKTFMPNIIMIDFANMDKCRSIMLLNNVAENDLKQLMNEDADAASAEEI